MNSPLDFDRFGHELALQNWLQACKTRMQKRYPKIAFESATWPIQSTHQTTMIDIGLGPAIADFEGRHPSFIDALRCIAAELALDDAQLTPWPRLAAYRLLSKCSAATLFDVSFAVVKLLESSQANLARENPKTVSRVLANLGYLSQHLDRLSAMGVMPRIAYSVRRDLTTELLSLQRSIRERTRSEKSTLLDHKIEALSDALNALFDEDPRMSSADRVSLALMGLEMCAPSRVNEPLCMSIDDKVALNDYTKRRAGQEEDQTFQAHQLLIVTMKGSKGAQWGAKPILDFMIDLFNYCLALIVKHGQRSRMLVTWYEQNPDRLFLPQELEHLRGKALTRSELWEVMNLRKRADGEVEHPGANSKVFEALNAKKLTITNPGVRKLGFRKKPLSVLPWSDVEAHLLARVHETMAACRRVTPTNRYKGKLSKMLFLFDTEDSPYLPSSLKYQTLRRRLKIDKTLAKREGRIRQPEPTVFERLGIFMPINGKAQFAEIETHDPRRWLTTQALSHREKLSDVLINKWARRLSIEHLRHYDFRTPEQKADQSAMPELIELKDLSAGLESIRKAEDAFGLKAEIITVSDAQISVTSMNSIADAIDTRPVATTSEQLFVVYPSWYGACIHQHHETPCRAYSSCLPCDNNLVVKGHLPTNQAIRERRVLLHRSIVEQLDRLAMAHSRGIPDNPDCLSEHILMLVNKGLNANEMAADLISRFQEIRHLIKDVLFANKLEEAFVAHGFVTRLDAPEIPSGALIKYHNPSRHAAPGVERAMDAHGGRAKMAEDREQLIRIYPQFASTSVGLVDQRSLVSPGDGDDNVDDPSDADFGHTPAGDDDGN